MKWKNRLEAVLTQNATSENSKECLKTQLRITAKKQNEVVSAVNRSSDFRHIPKKTIDLKEDERPTVLVSTVIHSEDFRHIPKNNDDLLELKSEKLHEILNRFIEIGINFEVSADEFQVLDTDEKLKISDKEFLQINHQDILCELQQSLLMKHLFSHSPEQFEDFVFEIIEREAIMTENTNPTFEIYIVALLQTTRCWFAELLEKK